MSYRICHCGLAGTSACNSCLNANICDWKEYSYIEAFPPKPADLVEVVRCENCKYWGTEPINTIMPRHRRCKYHGRGTLPEDYCSRGERGEGG